jgi:hypothetical protein
LDLKKTFGVLMAAGVEFANSAPQHARAELRYLIDSLWDNLSVCSRSELATAIERGCLPLL